MVYWAPDETNAGDIKLEMSWSCFRALSFCGVVLQPQKGKKATSTSTFNDAKRRTNNISTVSSDRCMLERPLIGLLKTFRAEERWPGALVDAEKVAMQPGQRLRPGVRGKQERSTV
ncbi:hypothetical protein MGYG_07988 [Nannizzia gypsea CBS 118893]|uniref:Uncharacterized protein n=1 Tax=Arthroderma gypseum (strain ATCC MYA-4604 / CBS 118893) TaxID=535722 RepID=E4V4R1_ARTGP|nr:hypothetical protein MGYG_07988 [Nannizzia gypsea CBS 118893]EFR04985.1 hypothetical protein MGYG_07988 [Nannizzia gypsea CBS 118893]